VPGQKILPLAFYSWFLVETTREKDGTVPKGFPSLISALFYDFIFYVYPQSCTYWFISRIWYRNVRMALGGAGFKKNGQAVKKMS